MLLFSEGVKENVRSHVKRDLLLPLMEEVVCRVEGLGTGRRSCSSPACLGMLGKRTGHQDAEVVGGADDAGAQRLGQLDVQALGVQDVQHDGEVLSVEGDKVMSS